MYSKYNLLFTNNCEESLILLSEIIKNFLEETASEVFGDTALFLICQTHLSRVNYNLFLKLCHVALLNEIMIGIPPSRVSKVDVLLYFYETNITSHKFILGEDKYIQALCEYYTLTYQVYHLQGNFQRVIKEHKKRMSCDKNLPNEQDAMAAHYSASLYLSKNKDRMKSRNVIENLMDKINKKASLSAEDYFIIAKYIEHHIQNGTSDEGLKYIPNIVISNHDEKYDSYENLNRVKLFRDVGQAMILSGNSDGLDYLDIAKSNAQKFGFRDQVNKIQLISSNLGITPLTEFAHKDYTSQYYVELNIHNNNITIGNNNIIKRNNINQGK